MKRWVDNKTGRRLKITIIERFEQVLEPLEITNVNRLASISVIIEEAEDGGENAKLVRANDRGKDSDNTRRLR